MSTRELLRDNSSEQSPSLNTVEELITNGLGYCCEWFFLELYSDAELIGLRLGVTTDTIRRHKKWKREGLIVCKQKDCCKKALLKKLT